ncbi:MAG: hypothetical protein A3G79_01545 [Gallionellales bacterium RIFCSPLOWO2_12_FULL_57_18]|nr:MAG: hypothetical protein A3G79_01545 [Gallionellales bacterium RIFCSPLOWO2_12_FULL_57_18]OGS96841.1 MAG: hypothetical protein A3H31_06070 [Gallionellales bacterium RIFCSPLOWO2_02_FULL_57_47]OGT09746.1 MAG: hypothetical protein A3J49_14430 [Gallionellales bacterium RIFCSPHIGHO2_02_FULL_57_16]
MQKKIIALAVAAAFSAPAFAADVNMYGIVDAAVARVSNSGQKSDMLAVSGGLSGSRVGIKAVEELDGGMMAVVVLEYALDTQTSSTIGAARQEMLALAGDFGTVATGYLQTTAYDFAAKFDPAFGSSVSPWQNMTKGNPLFLVGASATAGRAPRALAYISPDMGGVTVAVNHSTSVVITTPALGTDLGNLGVDAAAGDPKITATLLSVTYTGGPLTVGGVYAKASSAAAVLNDQTEMALGASYDLGVAKLMGTYQTTKNGAAGAEADKILTFSGVIPVGPGAIALSYAKATIAAGAGVDGNGSGLTVAYLQGLSKTVTAYGALSRVSNGADTRAFSVFNGGVANANQDLGASSSLIAVGLKKVF